MGSCALRYGKNDEQRPATIHDDQPPTAIRLVIVYPVMSDIEELLEETPPEVLRTFLARELAADPDLERRFHSFLDTSDLDVYELRDEIESKYGYQSAPNFSTYEERAESYIEKGAKPSRMPSRATRLVSATRTSPTRRNASTSSTVSTSGSTNTRREASPSTSERHSGSCARPKRTIATGNPCCGTVSTSGSILIDSTVTSTTRPRRRGVAMSSPPPPTKRSYLTASPKQRGCGDTSNCSTASTSRRNSEPSSTDTILRLDTSVSDTPDFSRKKVNGRQPLPSPSTAPTHSRDRIRSDSVSSLSISTRRRTPTPSGTR